MADSGITEWNSNKLMDLATTVNVIAMRKAALLVERSVKLSFQRQGSGRIYGKRKHQASLPGQTPAIDTGHLRASITNLVTTRLLTVNGFVWTDVVYAPWLELGTTKMQRRPFLRPALKRNKKKINKIFKEANE